MPIEITKISVKQTQPKLYSITLKMRYLDGEVEIINQDFTQRYRTGQNVSEVIERFREPIQKVINDYKSEQTIFTNQQLNNAIIVLKNSLEE